MNKKLLLVIVICVSFFLPWVTLKSAAAGKISELLTGKSKSNLTAISGFQVPILANGEESKLMIKIIKIFEPNITNANIKSFLIWLVPLLSVGMYWAGIHFKDKEKVLLAIGIIGITIFVISVFKIFTTDLDKVVLEVKIGIGLWLTFFSYLGLGIIFILDYLKLKK